MKKHLFVLFWIFALFLSHSVRADTTKDVLTEFYAGRYANALEIADRLPKRDIKQQLLRAQILTKLGKVKEAKKIVGAVDFYEGGQEQYGLFMKFRVSLAENNLDEALGFTKSFNNSRDGVLLQNMAHLELAKKYVELNQPNLARIYFEAVVESCQNTALKAEVLEQLIDGACERGSHTQACQYLATLIDIDPKNRAIKRLQDKVSAQFAQHQDGCMKNPRLVLNYVRALYAQEQYETIVKLVDPLIGTPGFEGVTQEMATYLGLSQYFRYSFGKAIVFLSQVNSARLKPELGDQVQYYLARSYQRSGKHDQAAREFQKVTRNPRSKFVAYSYFYLHEMYVKSGGKAESSPYFSALKRQKSSLFNKLVWNDVEAPLKAKKWDIAYAKLSDISTQSPDHALQSRLTYWKAKSLRYLNKTGQASSVLKDSVRNYPKSFYSYQTIKQYFPNERAVSLAPEVPRLEPRLVWLTQVGLGDVAKRILELDSSDNIDQMASLYTLMGDHYAAIWLVRTHFGSGLLNPSQDLEIPDELHGVMYPLAYWTIVKKESARYGLDPYLVLALIREESLFKSAIKSRVSAAGLMQLMPSTAQGITQRLKMNWEGPEMLANPEVNVRLGCSYLSAMISRFNGSLPLALSAYNAGPNITQKWVKERGIEDMDYFILSIPYAETQNYVQKVLQSYWIYQLTYKNRRDVVES